MASNSHDLNLNTIFTSITDLHFFTFSSDLRSFFVVVMNHFLSITMCTVNIMVTKDQSKVNIFLGPIRSWQVKCVKRSKRFDLVFVCHFSVLLLFRYTIG